MVSRARRSSACELARAAGVGVLSGGVCKRARREISFARGHGGSDEPLERAHYLTLYEALLLTAFHEPPAAVVEPVRGSSRELLAPCSIPARKVASLSRSERGRVGARARARARALLQGEARRGAARRGAARRAAAARGRSFCPGEAWRARRARGDDAARGEALGDPPRWQRAKESKPPAL